MAEPEAELGAVSRNLASITCPVCGMTSYNPNDIEWGYCGNCHAYTGVVNPLMKAKRFIEEETRHVENLDFGD
jgi:hypothetical protein